ncbi:MAG: hypothetical protein ACRDVM_10430, partial [Acidimicrobiia bacterium]
AVRTVTARLRVVERGWHPSVPERTYDGILLYQAPESIWLSLDDRTAYPDDQWAPNHTDLVVDESIWWERGPAPCPIEAVPSCTPVEPRVLAVNNRDPFSQATPAPLDLVVPAARFRDAAEGPTPEAVPPATGREVTGVVVAVAQAAPLLDGLLGAGNWRELHPTDIVELWLDDEYLVPVALSVLPASGEERLVWASRRGYDDPPGRPILELLVEGLEVNQPLRVGFPVIPRGATTGDAGFRTAPDSPEVVPGRLPGGFTLHRAGTLISPAGPEVEVASWSDGRAWVKVASTSEWVGPGLFGELGDLVRPAHQPAGIAYVSEDGTRVAVHGRGTDVVVSGTLSTEELLRVAASVGVDGIPVPAWWPEAFTATLDEARLALPGLLSAPGDLGTPAVRVVGEAVVLGYSGPGERRFELVQRPGLVLSPPFEPDVRGVEVRGTVARFTPSLGELEWVEGGRVVSLRSHSLGLSELVAIAERLESP